MILQTIITKIASHPRVTAVGTAQGGVHVVSTSTDFASWRTLHVLQVKILQSSFPSKS